jgi:hypothetical protein
MFCYIAMTSLESNSSTNSLIQTKVFYPTQQVAFEKETELEIVVKTLANNERLK